VLVLHVPRTGPKGLAFTMRAKLTTGGPTDPGSAYDSSPGPGFYHRESSAAIRGACRWKGQPTRLCLASASSSGSAAVPDVSSVREANGAAVRSAQTQQPVSKAPSLRRSSANVVETQPGSACDAVCTVALRPSKSDRGDAARANDEAGGKRLSLAQLNAQLAALLKHKGAKQARMQRYCADVAA
jgi:hypothetical protein